MMPLRGEWIIMASSDKNKSKSPPNKKNNSRPSSNRSLFNPLQGSNLEIVVAALLLTGKLRVDSVQLFRQATMIVNLTGKYTTLTKMNNSNVDKMIQFLNDNGNMTIDEIIQAFKSKTEQ